MPRANGTRGFTLVEVLVSAAIVAMIGGLVITTFSGTYYRQKRARDTALILESLALSLNNTNVLAGDIGFLQAVSRYPLRLSHLTNVAITTTDKQCSGAVYTTTQTGGWRSSPPFSLLNVLALKGVATPFGWIQDTVVKGTQSGTFGSSPKGYVELHIDSVSTTDVQTLDYLIDGVIDSSAGILRDSTARGTAESLNLHLVRYLIPAPIFRRTAAITPVDSTMGCY